jgi:hypothetical protein
MFKTSLFFLFVVAAAMAQSGGDCGSGFPASERQIMAGGGGVKGGRIVFRSVMTPAAASSNGYGVGGVSPDYRTNTVRRYMTDEKNKLYFGYELVVGPRDASGSWQATIQQLGKTDWIEPDQIAGMKFMGLPTYPAPQLVHDDETIAVDLMVSADGKSRLTDYIRLLPMGPPAPKATSDARDFTVDDGPVVFDPTQIMTRLPGPQPEVEGFTGKPGATFWIAPPGQGRYIVSLVPHGGFTKAGTVHDNVLAFSDAGQQFEVRFQSPIAGAGKAWNLYVMHDLTYQPPPGHSNGADMGTDRLDNLLPRN